MLNPEQQKAVDTHTGRLLCVAAPGSGKTQVIVDRILDIIKKGADPTDILSLTFTTEGAAEMRHRAARGIIRVASTARVSQAQLDRIVQDKRLGTPNGHHVFATFHSFALRLIKNERRYVPLLADNPVASPSERSKALRIAREGTKIRRKDLESYISLQKRKEITPTKATVEAATEVEKMYAWAYNKYQTGLAHTPRGRVLDYDDFLVVAAQLLRENALLRQRWQMKYMQIDEAQDTDALQWTITALLTQKHGNLFAVGDENQGMYGFRGAESELEKNFKTRWPEAQVLVLPQNYRSTPEIVAYCKKIAPLKNETVEKFCTANQAGVPVAFRQYDDPEQEANESIISIAEPEQTAILARTNAHLMYYENACMERGIKFQILGKAGFWRRFEVEKVVAHARTMVTPTVASVRSVIDSPYEWSKATAAEKQTATDFIGEENTEPLKCLSRMQGYSRGTDNLRALPDRFARFWNDVRAANAEPFEVLQKLTAEAGIIRYYQDKADEEEPEPDNDPLGNVNRLVNLGRKFKSLYDFVLFCEKAKHAPRAHKKALTLSTIHKAKGLQWPTVYVAGVTEGVLPHKMGDPDEEARIYFVACSRPEKRLIVTCYQPPSKFFEVDAAEVIEPPKTLMQMMEAKT